MDIGFEPQIISDYFKEITKIQHASGKEDLLRYWINEKVNYLKSKYVSDNRGNLELVLYEPDEKDNPGKRNILLRRNGGNTRDGKLPIILQAHMDMVTVPSQDIFPLQLEERLDAGGTRTWLKAIGTTLGADDGIGVATIFAVLEEETLKDVPLECLFTVQEETDMGGARNFDLNLLSGKQYINLDAEDLKLVIYGSAGGCGTQLKRPVEFNRDLTGYKGYTISVSGLKSGHSGVDINKGRQNALKIIANLLARLNQRLNQFEFKESSDGDAGINSYELLLVNIERTDEVISNKIPAGARAMIAIPSKQAENFEEDANTLFDLIKKQSQPVEDTFTYSVTPASEIFTPSLTKVSTDSLILLLNALPHGVIGMMPSNPLLVETSTNLYDVKIKEGMAVIRTSNRSSNINSLDFFNKVQLNIGNCYDFEGQINLDAYPAWEPSEQSKLLKVAKKIYTEKYQGESEATVVHAGLECGWISQKSEGKIECISIGPTIQNPHTFNERLLITEHNIHSVASFYDCVISIITQLTDLKEGFQKTEPLEVGSRQ